MAIIRCGFRSYVHEVAAIDHWVMQAGFVRVFEQDSFMWLTRVYARRSGKQLAATQSVGLKGKGHLLL